MKANNYVLRPTRRTFPIGQLLWKQFRWKYCLTDDGFAICTCSGKPACASPLSQNFPSRSVAFETVLKVCLTDDGFAICTCSGKPICAPPLRSGKPICAPTLSQKPIFQCHLLLKQFWEYLSDWRWMALACLLKAVEALVSTYLSARLRPRRAAVWVLSQPMRSIGVSQMMSLASDHIIVPTAGQSGCFQSVVTDWVHGLQIWSCQRGDAADIYIYCCLCISGAGCFPTRPVRRLLRLRLLLPFWFSKVFSHKSY